MELSLGHFSMLVLCSSFTGFGVIGGLSSAINTIANFLINGVFLLSTFRRALLASTGDDRSVGASERARFTCFSGCQSYANAHP